MNDHTETTKPRRRSRRFAIFLLVVAALAAAIIGPYQLVRAVPIIPGLRGCSLLADQAKQIKCIADRVVADARDEKLSAVLARLDEAAIDDSRIAASCHVAMHRAAAQRFKKGSSPEEALTAVGPGDRDCSIGYLHGSIETAVLRGSDDDIAALAGGCSQLERSPGDGREGQCYHGIGHGLRRSSSLDESVDACRTLLTFDPARHECHSGVFMEQTWAATEDLSNGSLSPIEPCPAFVSDDLAMSACMDYTAQKALVAGLDAVQIARLCVNEAPDGWTDECLFGYGRTLPTSSMRACAREGSEEVFVSCARGYLVGNLKASKVFELSDAGDRCQDLDDGDTQHSCARVLGEVIAADASDDAIDDDGCEAAFTDGALRRSCIDGGRS